MMNHNGETIGKLSGILYFVIMATMIPYMIWISDSFAKSMTKFDPVSELGNSTATKVLFQVTFIISGILYFVYVQFYLEPNRIQYKNFKCNKFTFRILKIGALGQIGVGIFPRELFPHHLLATLVFVAGLGGGITSLSVDLENHLKLKREGYWLALSGYIICVICLFNVFYFRYSDWRGIWQISSVVLLISWYMFEELLHIRIEQDLIPSSQRVNIKEVNKIAYVITGFAFLMMLFGWIMYNNPTAEPWGCQTSDQERCSPTTVMSMEVSAFMLIAFVFIYYSKIIGANVQKWVDKSIRMRI